MGYAEGAEGTRPSGRLWRGRGKGPFPRVGPTDRTFQKRGVERTPDGSPLCPPLLPKLLREDEKEKYSEMAREWRAAQGKDSGPSEKQVRLAPSCPGAYTKRPPRVAFTP